MASVQHTSFHSPSTPLIPYLDDPHLQSIIYALTHFLDANKAEEIVSLSLKNKTSMADAMIVASGRSQRHIAALAENIKNELKQYDIDNVVIEGKGSSDWVLIDAGALIIHLFRPEVREMYNLEKMWGDSFPPL